MVLTRPHTLCRQLQQLAEWLVELSMHASTIGGVATLVGSLRRPAASPTPPTPPAQRRRRNTGPLLPSTLPNGVEESKGEERTRPVVPPRAERVAVGGVKQLLLASQHSTVKQKLDAGIRACYQALANFCMRHSANQVGGFAAVVAYEPACVWLLCMCVSAGEHVDSPW